MKTGWWFHFIFWCSSLLGEMIQFDCYVMRLFSPDVTFRIIVDIKALGDVTLHRRMWLGTGVCSISHTGRIHVWYICLHLPYKSTKCRYIYICHTWILWVWKWLFYDAVCCATFDWFSKFCGVKQSRPKTHPKPTTWWFFRIVQSLPRCANQKIGCDFFIITRWAATIVLNGVMGPLYQHHLRGVNMTLRGGWWAPLTVHLAPLRCSR